MLDRAPDSAPIQQTVLEGVDQVEFFALDVHGNEYSYWGGLGSPGTELVGVIVRITVAPFGEIERVWEVPKISLVQGS